MTQFEVGQTYQTRSACDYDCIFSCKILARTAKTVTAEIRGKSVRRGIRVRNDVESFLPFGSYSMAAVMTADKKAA